ncbi:probable transcription initiation factor TFIID subunit 7 [Coccomyxa sp. Obi]|nr:probable transcription initiation factor TFIID subunit 7 [Coccomyxa sp. Obi]
MSGEREEQLILRVQDKDLADRIKNTLEDDFDASASPNIEIHFDEKGSGRKGTFIMGNDRFPLTVHDLPTIVESYKTYDDVNLVKTANIGQVLVVSKEGQNQSQATKCRHGVTPPMRDARKRMFQKPHNVDSATMRQLEEDLLTLAQGQAPKNMEIVDVEEEFVVDDAGIGSWQAVTKQRAPAPAPATKKQKAKLAASTSSGPAEVEEF